MPSRNTVKQYDVQTFYHVYNRGAGGRTIFLDYSDRQKFVSLLARYATPKDERDDSEKSYPEYDVEITAYCLMGNHFHLLLYLNEDKAAVSEFMRSVSTAYTMYFNKKYRQHGHLFQSIFKASRISDESYLLHITRYIHMNPRTYLTYRWSSINVYLGSNDESWVKADRVLTMSPSQYTTFLHEYKSKKAELEELKLQLAQ